MLYSLRIGNVVLTGLLVITDQTGFPLQFVGFIIANGYNYGITHSSCIKIYICIFHSAFNNSV